MFQTFLGRIRRNIPNALTLMVRLPENVIIVSPIMAPKPQNHPPFKILYIWVCGGMYGNFEAVQVQPIAIKFSLDVNKN